MEKLSRKIEYKKYDVQLEHIVSTNPDRSSEGLIDRLNIRRDQVKLEVPSEQLPMEVGFEPLSDINISPSYIRYGDDYKAPSKDVFKRNIKLKVKSGQTNPTKFRVELRNESEDGIISREFQTPPQVIVDWSLEILNRSFNISIFQEMKEYYSKEGEISAIKQFVDDISKYLSPHQFLRVLDTCAEALPAFREAISDIYTPEKIATFLPGGKYDRKFDIDSWPRLRQFCATSNQLRYVPTYDENEIVEEAISETTDIFKNQSETEFRRLWDLEQTLDISKRYPNQLTESQFVGLVAKAVYEENYNRVRDLVIERISPSQVNNLEDGIELAKDASTNQDWKGLLPIAAKKIEDQSSFDYVLANYLNNMGYSTEIPKINSVFLFKVSADLFEAFDMDSFKRSSKFRENYLRGIRNINIGKYGSAKQDLKRARMYSLEEIEEFGEARHTNLSKSWIFYCRAKMEYQIENGEIERAIDYFDKTVDVVKAYDGFKSEQDKMYCRTQIEALGHRARGDMHVRDRNYSEAKKSYGKAIGELQNLDHDIEKNIQYIKNNRLAIDALIYESEGEYESAATTYEQIESLTNSKDTFVKFHETRSEICRAKQAIVENELDSAVELINDVDYISKQLKEEIKQIEALVDLLRSYYNGEITNIKKAWELFDETGKSRSKGSGIEFDYGHNYRPAFVNIVAAQRLKNIVEEDDMIDHLVDVAIKDVLKPDEIDRIIDVERFNYSNFNESWKYRVPSFITSQLQDVKQKAAIKRSTENYFPQLKSQTGHLEECIEVFVAYDARRRYGQDWKSEIHPSGDVTLSNLKDYLNKNIFNSNDTIEEVRQLLSDTDFDDIVLDDQRDDIIGVRNDLAHNNVSDISESEFIRVRNHVRRILKSLANEMPVLAQVGEESQFGSYSLNMLVLDHRDQVEVMTDCDLQKGRVYYFPEDVITSEPVTNIDSERIQAVHAKDIVESIESHSHVELDGTN